MNCVFCRREITQKTNRDYKWSSCVVSIHEVVAPVCPFDVEKKRVRERVGKPLFGALLSPAEWKEAYEAAWRAR